jgi:hypothetical protein
VTTTYRPTLAALVLSIVMSACGLPPSSNSAEPQTAPAAAAAATQADLPPPAAAAEPEVAAMTLAAPVQSSKIGVPVEVRYVLAGVAARNQPARLDVAFVPRVEGANLEITFLDSESISIDAGAAPLIVARTGTSSVHRRRLTVTPKAADVGEIRVQVTMDVGGGRYSSIFVLPVSGAAAAAGVVR